MCTAGEVGVGGEIWPHTHRLKFLATRHLMLALVLELKIPMPDHQRVVSKCSVLPSTSMCASKGRAEAWSSTQRPRKRDPDD